MYSFEGGLTVEGETVGWNASLAELMQIDVIKTRTMVRANRWR